MYFNGPGRAELARLALHAGGVQFEDKRLSVRNSYYIHVYIYLPSISIAHLRNRWKSSPR